MSLRPASALALLLTLAGVTLAAAAGSSVAPDPLRPAGTGGLAAVDQALAKLDNHRRLLVIGAHPDDEDSSALAWVARELGGEAAYLSLSRGEGGQNLIGPELGAALGVVRSQELLAARRVDGGRQYFTRAFDFGYTRSLDETLRLWPREALFEDAVRVVRRFRPQVILSVFGDDGSGGHGQHMAAGFVAYRVSALAADPDFAPATGPAWRPRALYRAAWFAPEQATAAAALGAVEPISGRSIAQISALSRSQHRSQDMGRGLDLGPREGKYTWVAGEAGEGGSDLFAGIDTRLASLADLLAPGPGREAARARLERVEATARAAREELAPAHLERAAAALAEIRAELAALAAETAGAPPGADLESFRALLAEKAEAAAAGEAAARGIALDATADRAELVPGESAKIAVTVWNSGSDPLGAIDLEVALDGRVAGRARRDEGLAAGALARLEVELALPLDLAPTLPYYLRRPAQGALYDWSEAPEPVRGEPFEPPPIEVALRIAAGARAPLELRREVVDRRVDQAVGEVRRPLRVVPRVEVEVAPERTIMATSRSACPSLEVTLVSHAATALAGRLEARPAAGVAAPPALPFALAPRGRERVTVAQLPCPAPPGARHVTSYVAVLDDGAELAASYPVIDYPHLRRATTLRAAAAELVPLELEWPAVGPVGYIEGASDRVPEALAEAGLQVVPVGEKEVVTTDLGGFAILVIGSRAYEAQSWLPAANARLLEWVRRGGTLIVQYQQYAFVEGGFAPLPLEIARPHDRVTDEASPVTLLEPEHPAFRSPNRIAPSDFDGWVQERGLYFAHGWDPAYRPLLALRDPGQPEQRGALLMAPVGRGTYVYTGLAFFRQLPAGIPGAYRLFANLLALGQRSSEVR